MRKDHLATHDRWFRDGDEWRYLYFRRAHDRLASLSASARHGVSESRAVSASDRRRKRRLRIECEANRAEGPRERGRKGTRTCGLGPSDRAFSASTLRRTTAAGGAGAC